MLLNGADQAQAATFTWSGGSANNLWSTGANWAGAAPANDGTADVQFAGITRLTPDMDANWNIISLTFNAGAGAFTLGSLTGRTLTIQAGGITNNSTNLQTINNAITMGAAQTWNAASGALAFGGNIANGGFLLTTNGGFNTSATGIISGTGGLTKAGAGTLTLSGGSANIYSGVTTISAGTLDSQKVSGIGTGNVTLSGGTLKISTVDQTYNQTFTVSSGSTIDVATGRTFTLGNGANDLTGAGALAKTGAGTLVLTQASNHSGGVSINAGQVTIGSDTSLGTGTITLNGGTLFASGIRTLANSLNVTANSTLSASSSDDFFFTSNSISGSAGATLTLNNGNLTGTMVVNLDGSGFTFDSNVALQDKTRLRMRNSSGTNTLTGVISGTGDGDAALTGGFEVAQAGGTTILTGTNTYSSRTEVVAGTLIIQNSSALGSTAAGTEVLSGADLRLQGNISVGAETLALNGSGIASGGAFRNTSGTNSWAGAVTLQSASTIASDAGTLTISGTINNGTFLPTFTGAGNTTVSGIISNTGGLTKNGAGTLTLSGANTYSGTTTINAGQVTIGSDTALGTGTITLNGGTLFASGIRTLNNALSVTANSTLMASGSDDFHFNSNSISGSSGVTLTLVSGSLSPTTALNFYGAGFTFDSDIAIGDFTRVRMRNSSGTSTFTGVISGTGDDVSPNTGGFEVAQAGGTTLLTGTNTFTSRTLVAAGTLIIQNSSALGSTSAGTQVDAGADLRLQGNINVGAEALSLAGTGIGGAGALRNVSGTNSWAGALTLTAASTIGSDAGTVTVSGGIGGDTFALTVTGAGNTTVSGVISTTTGTLTKTGAGTLTLSNANTYTGATTVSAGRLNVTGSVTSAITVSSGATLSGKGGTTSSTIALNAGSTIIGVPQVAGFGNAFRSSGVVTAGAGTLISGSDGNATVGAGHNIDVVGYGTSPGTANFSTANYRPGTATIADDAANKKITLTYTNSARTWNSAASTWDVGTTNAWQGGDLKFYQGDTVTFDDSGTGGGGSRTVTLNSLVTPSGVTFSNSTSTYTVSGTGGIGSATAVTKAGTGTVNMATGNSYYGTTTVSAGVLNIQNATALGTTDAGTTVSSGAALQIQGNIAVGAEALTLNGSGISSTGALRNISGNNFWGGAVTLGSASTIASDAGSLTHTGTLATSGFVATYTGAGNITASGVISGTGGVTKTGAGTLTMSGASANTFSGNTTVSAGTLAANADGALGSTAKVTINTGGTVLMGTAGGNDRIGNTVEVDLAGGTFNTGGFTETVGKMTLSGNSTFDFGAGASIFTFDGEDSSLGSSTLTVFNWTGTLGTSGGTDQLRFQNSSFTADSITSQVQFNIGGTLYNSIFLDVGSSTMELVPVPEPTTILGAGALVLAVAWRERRRFAGVLPTLHPRAGAGRSLPLD